MSHTYNTKFECRYHMDNVFCDTDDLTDEEKYIVRDFLYKEDFINILNIDSDDDDVINHAMKILYNDLVNSELVPIMEQLSNKTFMIANSYMGLCVLYSFDYMHLTHSCVSEYLETGKISENHLDRLNVAIKNIV